MTEWHSLSTGLKRAYAEIKSSSKTNEATSLLCMAAAAHEMIAASV